MSLRTARRPISTSSSRTTTARKSCRSWYASSTLAHLALLLLTWVGLSIAPATDSVAAADRSRPSALVQQVGEATIGLLTDPNLSDYDREQKVRSVLQEAFAVDLVGRFVLGHYWRKASPEQRDAYQEVFREYVVNSIAARFGEYSGEQMQVVNERDDHGKGSIVNTLIDSPVHGLVKVQWRVREVDGEHKIIDVIVEGVSLLLTQRSEFNAVISNYGGDVGGLITDLKEKVEELKAQRPPK